MSERTNPLDNVMPQEPSAALTVSEARRIYVQNNYDAYAPCFERFDKNQRRFMATWSWWGFLFTSGWLFYRKMYLPFLAYFAVSAIIALFTSDVWPNAVVSIGGYDLRGITAAIAILLGVPFGIAGRWLYYRQVNGMIGKARNKSNNDRAKMSELLKLQGRLNHPALVALAVYLVLPFCLSIIISSIITMFLANSL